MEQEERIRILLSVQEHPEQYSDEQLRQMFADDSELSELLEELALTKQALVKQEADREEVPVEEEWEKFSFGQTQAQREHFSLFTFRFPRSNVAASFIGIMFAVGMAFAAVRIARQYQRAQDSQDYGTAAIAGPSLTASHSSLPADSASTQSVVFDNTPLEKMLPQIAAYYNKEVEFASDDARQLRFHFVWKPDRGLEATLHRLNLFESIDIKQEGNKIVVK